MGDVTVDTRPIQSPATINIAYTLYLLVDRIPHSVTLKESITHYTKQSTTTTSPIIILILFIYNKITILGNKFN